MTDKEKIQTAFKELRVRGFFARRNFKCCQSCGCAAIPEAHEERYVFYHSQDNESFDKTGHLRWKMYLAFGGDGQEIVSVLRNIGLSVEWDGAGNTRIAILPKEAKEAKGI